MKSHTFVSLAMSLCGSSAGQTRTNCQHGLGAGQGAGSFGALYVNLARHRPSLSGTGAGYSHSIVDGGFDEMSRATRFTAGISLMIRLEIVSSRS